MNWPWTKLERPEMYTWGTTGGEDHNGPPTYEVWEENTKAEYPIRFFIQETLPDFWRYNVIRPLSDAWGWVKGHTYRKHYILDLRDKRYGYSWGWIDRDHAILLASFKLLEKFVLEELDMVYWDTSDDKKRAYLEIRDLYFWWTVVRPEEHKAVWGLLDEPGSSFSEEENRLFEVDTAQLKRLMDVRVFLWT